MLTPSPSRPRSVRNAWGRALPACTLLAALAASAIAAPGVWRCADGTGVPVYQDRPCGPGENAKDLAADPPPLSVVPFAPPREAPRAQPRRAEKAPPRAGSAGAKRVTGNPAERRHVHEGMSEGEVLARLGTPDLTSGKGGRRMRWTFLPAPGDPQTMTLIRFEDGRVAGVERVVVR